MKLDKFCYNGLRWVLVVCAALLVQLVSSGQIPEGVGSGVGMEPLGASGVESVLEGASRPGSASPLRSKGPWTPTRSH